MNYQSNVPSSEHSDGAGRGEIIVKVTTAKYAIPLAGANVVVYDAEDSHNILYNLRTDSTGATEKVSVKAPPASDSQSPGASHPFASVNIDVSMSGYNPVEFFSVPVFDKILSVQRADLVPLSENGERYIYDFKESELLETPENNL